MGTAWILSGIGWRNGNGYLVLGFLQDEHTEIRLGFLVWKVNNDSSSYSG